MNIMTDNINEKSIQNMTVIIMISRFVLLVWNVKDLVTRRNLDVFLVIFQDFSKRSDGGDADVIHVINDNDDYGDDDIINHLNGY